jgi:hypothetical protein
VGLYFYIIRNTGKPSLVRLRQNDQAGHHACSFNFYLITIVVVVLNVLHDLVFFFFFFFFFVLISWSSKFILWLFCFVRDILVHYQFLVAELLFRHSSNFRYSNSFRHSDDFRCCGNFRYSHGLGDSDEIGTSRNIKTGNSMLLLFNA